MKKKAATSKNNPWNIWWKIFTMDYFKIYLMKTTLVTWRLERSLKFKPSLGTLVTWIQGVVKKIFLMTCLNTWAALFTKFLFKRRKTTVTTCQNRNCWFFPLFVREFRYRLIRENILFYLFFDNHKRKHYSSSLLDFLTCVIGPTLVMPSPRV